MLYAVQLGVRGYGSGVFRKSCVSAEALGGEFGWQGTATPGMPSLLVQGSYRFGGYHIMMVPFQKHYLSTGFAALHIVLGTHERTLISTSHTYSDRLFVVSFHGDVLVYEIAPHFQAQG